ncbi:N-acetyltransferase [Pseudomonas sp. P7779]|uniref:N-acetyltransferase n=1 Tax=Pseudomonas sp. P7779 TaxID=2738832 RepID=UPI0015B9842D|nr:N-acetyltransferase [Pseudomonas sp. P7779]NWC97332.1 N-acetyltransferase [Pseudomonas sp. P7779]
MELRLTKFADVNFNDVFFDSLKQDYAEIPVWFEKKAQAGDSAYVFYGDAGAIDGFLYLKVEDGVVSDINPPLPYGRHVKVGTLKINAHGTKLGERFLKKIFDYVVASDAQDVYVTVFEKHGGLISLFERYGFEKHGNKVTPNGVEWVLYKQLSNVPGDITKRYPVVLANGRRKFLLTIYPEFHTRLFPDSILNNEDPEAIIKDVSHTNSIHKVYICKLFGADQLRCGDVIVIYRTGNEVTPAWYSAVATSICVIQEVVLLSMFRTVDDFLAYCLPFSVFSEEELRRFYRDGKYPYILRFSYNYALPKRLNRATLVTNCGMVDSRWGCTELNDRQFSHILELSGANENIIIN